MLFHPSHGGGLDVQMVDDRHDKASEVSVVTHGSVRLGSKLYPLCSGRVRVLSQVRGLAAGSHCEVRRV